MRNDQKEAERGKDRVWRNAFSHLEKDNHCHQIGAPCIFLAVHGPLATASHWNHHLLSQPRHPAWNSRSSSDHLELNGTSAPVDPTQTIQVQMPSLQPGGLPRGHVPDILPDLPFVCCASRQSAEGLNYSWFLENSPGGWLEDSNE